VRFNPLLFRFEVDDLALSDPAGQPLLGFKRLLVDFELRSVIDGAWTFSEATLEAPVVHFSLDKDGRHNFASLLERLPKSEPDQQDQGLPRFIVQRVALTDGRIEFSDQLLDDPLVARIEPLLVEIDNLSSLPGHAASYRLSARSAADEAVESSGELALNPIVSKGKLTLSGLQVATLVRSLPRLLAVDSPAGKLALGASFDLAVDAGGTLSGLVQDLDFAVAELSLSAAGAASPLLAIGRLSLQQGRVDLTTRQASLADFRLAKGRIALAFDKNGKLNWEGLVRPTVTAKGPQAEAAAVASSGEGAAPVNDAREAMAPGAWRVVVNRAEISAVEVAYSDPAQALVIDVAALGFETSPSIEFAAAGMQVALVQPKLSLSGTRLQSGADKLAVPDGVIAAGKISMVIADAGFDLAVDQVQTSFDGVKAQNGANSVDLRRLVIASDKLSLAQTEAGTRIGAGAAQASLTGVVARQGADRIALHDASLDVRAIAAALGGGSPASSGLGLRFDDLALKLTALGVVAQGASSEVAQISAAKLGAKSLLLALPDGQLDLNGEGLSVALSDAIFHSPADAASEMFRAARVNLSGGVLRLKDRVLTVDQIALVDGKAQTWLDAEGRFNGMIVTRAAADVAAEAAAASAGDAVAVDSVWRVAVKSTEVDAFALAFEDRRGGPPLAVGLESIRARIAGFETGVTTPMQVEFKAKVVSGGEIEARGSVRADNGTSDLQLKLAAIALAPVQPFLSGVAELHLATGTLSTAGRLRYGDPAATGAQLAYQGSFAVDKLQIDEVEPKRPFVTWEALTTDDLLLTVEPNRLDIGELQILAPAGRLIIAEDQSVNLTDVLKKPKNGEAAPGAAEQASAEGVVGSVAAEAKAGDEGATVDDPFPVSIARLRVARGALEFADLSLRPQFGARMHELKGVVTGLGSDANRSAKVQLDARVDKYGSAKIRGQINVFRPEKLTDIEMTFRNLTMSSLSPYVIKFAGRRIEGGQLALDLQYKVKD
ncbi:DUF748 domain-containing protein, partial [Accumulibacter sp.]|uniref:DUF748 domain-containing protein n=1 Tax=Accumulibacter sp. TaxID=2053492 RepID=UPI0028C4CEDD